VIIGLLKLMILLVIYYGKTIGGNSIDHLTSAKKRRMAVTSLAAPVLLEYLEKTQNQEER
jgi:hypothetical protein